jgi:hypothetical protein
MKKIPLLLAFMLVPWLLSAQEIRISKTITLTYKHPSLLDHYLFDQVLHKYVRNGLVDYEGLRKDTDFFSYIGQLEKFNPDTLSTLTENVRLAFWINAYNAYTLKLVLDYYPIRSIKEIGGAKSDPWQTPIANIGGTVHTLYEIEHKIIGTEYDDPRICFSLAKASKGGPMLRSETYVADRLNEQLENATQTFLSDTSKNYLDKVRKKLYLSRVFESCWASKGKKYGSVSRFVARYFDAEGSELIERAKVRVEHRDFDWSLNKQ